jgi:DNA-binding CsgD family transcriptional regulator
MVEVIAGRDGELASLRDFVESISGGAVALVLEGEAGMGKTTLWRAAVEEAEELGLVVLRTQPVESEATLSFAGVGDLLDPVLDVALEGLPAAQRNALSRALALGDEDGPAVEPRALRVALQNVLRRLAEERPVLVAIDDSQWLDEASAAGLAYGLRRFRADRIGLLLARRSGLLSMLLNELVRSPVGERVTHVHVGPLDVTSLGRVVQEHLGATLPRPLLAEVHQASGGSPFYALEIVRMLKRSDISIEAGQPLPVPESLHDLVRGRLLALPRESRDFLLAASAHAHPTIALTEAASQVTREAGLAPALEARLVDLDGDRIRFTHPLLAAGAYETGDPLRRQEIHVRLADLLDDPEARAWQLAACVTKPDGGVADTLVAAAEHARARGALRPAALLLDRAHELTPVDRGDEGVRRGIEAAYLHFESGDSRRAEAELQQLIAPLGAGSLRAKALVVLARIRLYESPVEARGLFAQVVEEAGEDLQTLAVAHEGVAASSIWVFEDLDRTIEHSEIALALADDVGDAALAGDVLMTRLTAETLLGLPTASSVAEQALALQESAADQRVLDQPLASLAEYWTWTDEQERARSALVDLMRRAEELGDENARPWLLLLLSQSECMLGALDAAFDHVHEAREAAAQSGQPLFAGLGNALECLVQAQRGRAEEARQAANRIVEGQSESQARLMGWAGIGHLELVLGRTRDVVDQLGQGIAFVERERILEPGATRFVIDQVEALIELGRRDEAGELLDWYEGNARRLERMSALANCLRCRGLLAAAEGLVDEAIALYGEALILHEQVELPLDRARTLLALGAAQRRAKRRREARATLEEALGVFERIGAALWAERARAELARISGRAATPGALTPAEERVAALVAEGKTNREVAAALFLSDRTVEGHLTHVFGKLGIKHRSEVGPALAARQTPGVAVPNTGDSPVSAAPSAP